MTPGPLDDEEVIRRQVAALIKLGVKKQAIAAHVDRDPSWVGRWLKRQAGELSINQLRGLIAYVHQMGAAITEIEQHGPARDGPDRSEQQSAKGKKRAG